MSRLSGGAGHYYPATLVCSIILAALLLAPAPASARLPVPLRGLAQVATDAVPAATEVPAAADPAAPVTDPAATAAAVVPAAVEPATVTQTAPAVPTEPTADASTAATAPLEVAAAPAELPPPDAVAQGIAADGSIYTPAADDEATGPVTARHITAKKLYLYAWCGVTYANMTGAQPHDNDYVATIDATPGSTNYGKILSVANTPYAGSEAHHGNVDKTGKWLGVGGLLSVLYPNTPDIFMFDLTNPAKPVYKYGLTGTSGACVDEFVAHKDGGFVATAMCGRDGHTGGGIMRITNPSTGKMYEYTGGVSGADLATHASHGVGVDYGTNRMVTADYIDVASALSELKVMHTASVWDMATMKVLKKVDLTGITDGLMEARWTGVPWLFWVSGGLGKLHLINAKTFKVTPNVFCFSPTCETTPGTCLTTDVFDGPYGGKRMLVTSMSLGQVRLLDVTKPDRVKTLDTYQLPAGAGAHVVKFDKNTWTAAVATYLLDIPGTVEAIHFKSDQTVRLFYVDLYKNKIVPKGAKGLIDFKTAVPERPGNCHGLAFNYI